jgi:uncharacterized protein
VGSLRNKLLFILPAALLLSQFLPWLLTPILMLGGTYLCYEGAHKVWEKVSGHHEHADAPGGRPGPGRGRHRSGAVRTDFILSAEIMVIALNEVADEPLVSRAIILAWWRSRSPPWSTASSPDREDGRRRPAPGRAGVRWAQRIGRGLVRAMPRLLRALSVVGIAAMLWVGGHILLVGLDELGLHWLYDAVHHAEEAVAVMHVVPWRREPAVH